MKSNSILFWNVDTQIDFMEKNGKLYVEGAERIKPILSEITNFAKENNLKVVNTADYHKENSAELSETPDFKSTFPAHCMMDSKGAKYIEETQPETPCIVNWWDTIQPDELSEKIKSNRNIVIRKDAFDVFSGNPYTNDIVKSLNFEVVYVYGVTTNVCVDFAVKGLVARGYRVVVFENAMKELSTLPVPFEEWKKLGVEFQDFSLNLNL